MSTASNLAGLAELRSNRLLYRLLMLYLIVWVVTAIHPLHREDWLLENLLVFAACPVLCSLYRHRILSNLSYLLLFLFFTLHSIGTQFTYSDVPLGNWLRDTLHLSRNHYDRAVHFAFGLLIAYPLHEVLLKGAGVRRGWSHVLAVHVVAGWSAVYEVVEGIVADLVRPDLGATFNGTQGDIWDAQKDMSLAIFGAVVCMLLTVALARSRASSVLRKEEMPGETQAEISNQSAIGFRQGEELALWSADFKRSDFSGSANK